MISEMENKLSAFIDDLIKYRYDDIEFYITTKRNNEIYHLEIDTKVPTKPLGNFGISFGNQKIIFSVSPNTGSVTLYRDDYKSFGIENMEFSKKYAEIIKNSYLDKQVKLLDDIVDNSYTDLNLKRESNLGKLIG